LQLAPRLAFLARFVFRALRNAVGRYDCVDVSTSSEFSARDGNAKQPTAGSLARAAASKLEGSKRSVMVVSDGQEDLRRSVAAQHFDGRAVWMDDYIPRWLVTDYDMPGSNRTSARALVELLACAKAERFLGNVAAPSTHAVCHHRHASRKAGPKSNRMACEDALGRQALPPFF
jgi:hypothetical protein